MAGMIKKILSVALFGLCCVGAAFPQGTTTKIRSASSLPATCTAGTATVAADAIYVGGSLYICTATNTWTLQASNPSASIIQANGGAIVANAFTNLVDGSTILWAVAGASPRATVSLGGNHTLNVTGMSAGVSYTMLVVSNGYTLSQGSGCTWQGGWVLPGATGGDLIGWIYDGTNCHVVGSSVVGISHGTATMESGTPVTSYSCATVVSVAATGVTSSSIIDATPTVSFDSISGYSPSSSGNLTVDWYPTSGFVNFNLCNRTGTSITPASAMTFNWSVRIP